MSSNNNGIVIAGLIVAYLYMKRTQVGGVVPVKAGGLPASMPATVGSGAKQIAVGAIAGLLQGLASSPWNNTSQTVFPTTTASSYGAVQDVVGAPASLDEMLSGNTDTTWWA